MHFIHFKAGACRGETCPCQPILAFVTSSVNKHQSKMHRKIMQ